MLILRLLSNIRWNYELVAYIDFQVKQLWKTPTHLNVQSSTSALVQPKMTTCRLPNSFVCSYVPNVPTGHRQFWDRMSLTCREVLSVLSWGGMYLSTMKVYAIRYWWVYSSTLDLNHEILSLRFWLVGTNGILTSYLFCPHFVLFWYPSVFLSFSLIFSWFPYPSSHLLCVLFHGLD